MDTLGLDLRTIFNDREGNNAPAQFLALALSGAPAKEAEVALALADAEGWNSSRKVDAEKFLDYGSQHLFPSPRGLVRYALFVGLDFLRTVHLVVKGAHEQETARRNGWQPGDPRRFDAVLRDGLSRNSAKPFNPSSQMIFAQLEEHGRQASANGYSERALDTLLQQMIQLGLHLRANESRELEEFIAWEAEECRLLGEASPQEAMLYRKQKKEFTGLHSALEEKWWTLDGLQMEHGHIRQDWRGEFGESEIERQEQALRAGKCRRRIKLAEHNERWGEAELEEADRDLERRSTRSLGDLREDVALAQLPQPDVELSGPGADPVALAAHEKKLKRKLLEVKMKAHPDAIKNHKNWVNLLPAQQLLLEEEAIAVMAIRSSDLRAHPGHLEHDHLSLSSLQHRLDKINAILDHAGIDIDVDFLIRGSTIPERLEFLQSEIARLEHMLQVASTELEMEARDPEIARLAAELAVPSRYDEIRAALDAEAASYRAEADELEAQLTALLRARRGGAERVRSRKRKAI